MDAGGSTWNLLSKKQTTNLLQALQRGRAYGANKITPLTVLLNPA
jgi:hypothetical protein